MKREKAIDKFKAENEIFDTTIILEVGVAKGAKKGFRVEKDEDEFVLHEFRGAAPTKVLARREIKKEDETKNIPEFNGTLGRIPMP